MYEEVLKRFIGEKRFRHSVNVSNCAKRLAKKYGADEKKAEIAGMLHDIMKERTFQENLEMIKKEGISLSRFEMEAKKLLHAIAGSIYVKNFLDIKDSDILNAIRYHTTGREGMSVLEKVVFVADFISDDRDYKGVDELRKLEEKGLEHVMLGGLKFMIEDLVKEGKPVHTDTFAAYNECAFKREKKKKHLSSEEIANKICKILDDKKAKDINKSDIKDASVISDYFIFANGTSSTHVKSLAEEVKLKLKEEGIFALRKEEDTSGTWVLLDYGDVIVHIFTENARNLYNLEELWDRKN